MTPGNKCTTHSLCDLWEALTLSGPIWASLKQVSHTQEISECLLDGRGGAEAHCYDDRLPGGFLQG